MPYDDSVQMRINAVLRQWSDVVEKKMFGGVCCLLHGNMVCGVYKEFLILRLGVDQAADALTQPHCRPFDITGRAMKGWVMVAPEGFADDRVLADWLAKAKAFVETLPPK
ncbi:MAG: TfoX/Sxy family protein [Desulfosarcinaceae bacterium]|nr:TfoX/Sxy family protein [Desulfosarcinaceae bacterium]